MPASTAIVVLLFLLQRSGQPALERLEQQVQAETTPDIEPGYLGLIADDRQDQGRRIRIVEVAASGPAATAGLQVGDVIISVNQQPTARMTDLERIMLASPAGSELTFEVQRGGEPQSIKVTLGRREAGARYGRIPDELPQPERPAPPPPSAYLGIRAMEVSGELLRRNNLPELTQGAAVQSTVAGSPAYKAAIPADAVVVGANGEGITSPADLLKIVARSQPGDSLELAFYNRGQLVRRTVKLEAPRTARDVPAETTASKPIPVDPPNAIPAPKIEVLEQRVLQLEQRVEELERALQRTAPGAAGSAPGNDTNSRD